MRREVEILNLLGLHARPAAEFVRCVHSFDSEITIQKGDERFDAHSILEVLSANLDCGTRIILEAIGADAHAALDRLEKLLFEFKEQEKGGMTKDEGRMQKSGAHFLLVYFSILRH